MFRIIQILVFLLCGASGALASESPEISLANLQHAIDSNDSAAAERYIDVAGIIRRGVNVFVADYASRPPAGDANPVMDMLMTSIAAGGNSQEAQSTKELLAQETRKFVLWGVASGSFSGQPSSGKALPDGGIFSGLFADASAARKEIRAMKVTPVKADTAKASVKFYDHGSEKSYPVEALMKLQPEGHWKVTDITNMASLISSIRKESAGR